MAEEFDLKETPFNPRIMETFLEFARRQKEANKADHGGAKVECRRCGDCCTWNFYKVQVSDKLIKELKSRDSDPHGYWILGDHILNFYLIFWDGEADEPCRTMRFTGPIGEDYYQFHKVSNRRQGYWVIAPDNWILLYSPNKCVNLLYDKDGLAMCKVYENRPKICRGYFCGRYPVIPKENNIMVL